MGSNTR